MQNNQTLLEKYLSKSRLKKYAQIAQNDDFEKALEIYRLNIKYSEKFYSALIQFEVILRNAINEQFRNSFGDAWHQGEKISFVPRQKGLISALKLDLKTNSKLINSCNIVSNLTFGFWVNLFNPEYDKTLWRQSLAMMFNNKGKIPKRGIIRNRLKNFHMLRNRISHCEPIVQFPLLRYYRELIELVGWINNDLALWMDEEIDFNSINKLENGQKI